MLPKTAGSKKDKRALAEHIEDALGETPFRSDAYCMEELETWLWLRFEDAQKNDGVFGEDMSAQSVWTRIVHDCFSLCESQEAKEVVWEAIAQVSMLPTPHQQSFIRGATPFLYERREWMPQALVQTPFAAFAGMFMPDDYDLPTMLVAAQHMGCEHIEATHHIEQWMTTLRLAPQMLPKQQWSAEHHSAITGYVSGKTTINSDLWAGVVLPYCQKYPLNMLAQDKSFIYLPLYPTGSEIALFAESMPSLAHQDQVYANVMNMKHSPTFRFNMWSDALPSGLPETHRDLRLYLALEQVTGPNAKRLVDIVDKPLVAMLESLDTFDADALSAIMRETLLARWLGANTPCMELPAGDWGNEGTVHI